MPILPPTLKRIQYLQTPIYKNILNSKSCHPNKEQITHIHFPISFVILKRFCCYFLFFNIQINRSRYDSFKIKIY